VLPDKLSSSTKELGTSFWQDIARPWLDFRFYLTQRDRLSIHANLALAKNRPTETAWKSPLLFAVQGMLIVSLAVHIVDRWLQLVVPQEDRPIEIRDDLVRDRIRNLTAQLLDEKTPEGDRISIKADLQENQNVLTRMETDSRIENAIDRAYKFSLPIYLVCSAWLFKWMLRPRKGSVPLFHVDEADSVYLYCVTGAYFWLNLAWAASYSFYADMRRYYPAEIADFAKGFVNPVSLFLLNFFLFSGITQKELIEQLEPIFREEDAPYLSDPSKEVLGRVRWALRISAWIGPIVLIALVFAGTWAYLNYSSWAENF
jgi:hypothetical protein